MEDVTLLFTLGAIPSKNMPFSPFGGCWQGEDPHLKVLVLVIPYSGNPKEDL